MLHDPRADLWMLFDYDAISTALRDVESFSSRAAPPGGRPFDWLIFSDPPRHTQLRGIISRAFTPRIVSALEPRIREIGCELLDSVLERGEMDVATEFSGPLPVTVIAELLGIPLQDRARFKRWSDAILGLANTVAGAGHAAQAVQDFAAAKAEMAPYLADLVAERRSAPRNDLLTKLVEAELDGARLSDQDLLGFFQHLLLAGTETTANLINNALLCFIENPEQLSLVRRAPELLPSAIEEVLRYRSPVQAVFRATRCDVALQGKTIPAGKLVLVMIGSANRDPRQFADADRFDVRRAPNPHLAFGHGIHFCLGAALSRLEASVALATLLESLEDFGLATDEPWEPRKAFHVHGPTRLPIRFRAKQHAR